TAGKPLEIVFISRDRAKADLEEYFQDKHGDWLALNYGDDRITRYQSKFDIKTIPVLRVIKSDGTMVVTDGRADINARKAVLLSICNILFAGKSKRQSSWSVRQVAITLQMKRAHETSSSRFERRLDEVKRKARPELVRFGWETLRLADSLALPEFKDNILRVDSRNLSVEEFREKYEQPRIPVILTGLTHDWQATQKWTVERIARKYRNQKFKCGEDDDGYSVKLKMKYFVDYMRTNTDDSPLYVFDSGFGDRHKTKQLLEDYVVPKFWEDDLFNYAEYRKRPPHRWFVMGSARSGTGIHIDPLGTSAWNSLILGHKRWVLVHPDAPRALVKTMQHEKGKHPDEAVTWFTTVYNRLRHSSWNHDKYPVIEARQCPGETMFVPSGWWHVVLNEDDTIAITQNYCSIVNLPVVWPKTVKGRPKLSKHWYRKLATQRPELLPIIQTSNDSQIEPDSSSDSSSSSSSSSDSSGEESECEREDGACAMRNSKRRKQNGGGDTTNGSNNDGVGQKKMNDDCHEKRRRSAERGDHN
ncbi:hypothetical protein WR25_11091, partial [Diploscapter pachys]